MVAPSLKLKATGDHFVDRYPFSVKPDQPISVQKLFSIMRDGYEGTRFDLTEHPAFNPQGNKSPLARPWGPTELFDLLDIKPNRALCTPTSGYVLVAQLRDWLPDSFGNCLWFAYGPAYTSCFVPIYTGVTDLPDAWDQPPDYTKINRNQVPWNFRLVFSLANNLQYQDAMQDIRHVYQHAETEFFKIQPHIERTATNVLRKEGSDGIESFLNKYAQHCLKQVGYAYNELVDYLMFQYLVDHSEVAPPKLPVISAPVVPTMQDN
jgi:dipeptidase